MTKQSMAELVGTSRDSATWSGCGTRVTAGRSWFAPPLEGRSSDAIAREVVEEIEADWAKRLGKAKSSSCASCSRSPTQVSDRGERRHEAVSQLAVDVPDLVEEGIGDGAEGALQLAIVERPHEARLQRGQDLRRQIVGAASVGGGNAVAHGGQGEHLVARGADHVLGLPRSAARDARAGVQGVEPSHSDQLHGVRRLPGRPLVRGAEQQPEARPDRPELGRGPEGDVDLKRAREQEDAEERRAEPYVDVMDGAVLVVHPGAPVLYDAVHLARIAHAQSEIDVRPAVLTFERRRARERGGGDARVVARGRDERVAERLSLGWREHPPILAPPRNASGRGCSPPQASAPASSSPC